MGAYYFFGGLFLFVIAFGIFAFLEAKAYNTYMEEKSQDPKNKDTLWASLMPPEGL